MDEQALRTRSRIRRARNTFLTFCTLSAALLGAACLCWVVHAVSSTLQNVQTVFASGHTHVAATFCALALAYAAGAYYYLFCNFHRLAGLFQAAHELSPSTY